MRAFLSRAANLLSVSRTIRLRVIAAYTNLNKVSSTRHKSWRNSKLEDHDRRMFKRIVAKNCKTTLTKLITEINPLNHRLLKTHLQNPVPIKTI